MFGFLGIFPEAFKVIELSMFMLKYMYYNINIVNQCPLLTMFYMVRFFAAFSFNHFNYRISYCLYLYFGFSFTKNKKIRYCFVYLSQIQRYNFFTFLFLYGIYNSLEKFTVSCKACCGLFPSLQCRNYFIQIVFNLFKFGNIFIPFKIKESLAVNLQAISDAPIIELDTIDSTNNYAMRLIDADTAQPGLTIVAGQQTKGKGQRGNVWLDSPGENLLMSIIIAPVYGLEEQFVFNMAVTTAIADALQSLHEHWDVRIKWPNDIIINDKKAGGILIENVLRGNMWLYSIVGFGLNVLQDSFSTAIPNATSLRKESGKIFNIKTLFNIFRLAILRNTYIKQSPHEILKNYNDHLFRKGCNQYFDDNSEVWQGVITGVNLNGQLMVVHEDGNLAYYAHGSVAWVWDKA